MLKKLYYFGYLDKPWEAWVFYGTEKECRKFLRKENVSVKELDTWMEQAVSFTKDNKELM